MPAVDVASAPSPLAHGKFCPSDNSASARDLDRLRVQSQRDVHERRRLGRHRRSRSRGRRRQRRLPLDRQSGAVELTPGTASLAIDVSDSGDVTLAHSWEEALISGAVPENTFIWDVEHGTRTSSEIQFEPPSAPANWWNRFPRQRG